ncbi:MAG: acyl-CoA thioesterase [Ignavibacteria bacterium]
MDLSDYRHKVSVRVRTFEVDSQGIVHNINYLKYLEIGRVEYRRNMGYNILPNGIFNDGLKVVVVRNEIDYLSYSYLDDLLDIYTKISWIKNSSFCFEQIVQRDSDKTCICKASGILVNINSQNNSEKLPINFINQIKDFEKNLKLI